MFRKITSHIAPALAGSTEALAIESKDVAHINGANHVYRVSGFRAQSHPSYSISSNLTGMTVYFQSGNVPNGVTVEAMLAITADHLRGIASGPFGNADDAEALAHIEAALTARHRKITNGGAAV